MIEIIKNGPATSLQDSGRPGLRHLGIPESGAADRLNFALANHCAGNQWNAPALECALGGLQVRFNRTALFALAGADMGASIEGRPGARPVEYFKAQRVEAGDILTLGFAHTGCRAYLAIAGGIKGTEFAGSVATYTPAKVGGIEGCFLKVGDRLENAELSQSQSQPQNLPRRYAPKLSRHIILRTRPGPEADRLSPHSRRALFTRPFTATTQTDRMGSRLQGPTIKLDAPFSMNSSPLLPGTAQVPADGNLILALVDGHCTGGYPRALQVIRADLWLLGQISPHTKVSFQRSFETESEYILRCRNVFYGGLMGGFTF